MRIGAVVVLSIALGACAGGERADSLVSDAMGAGPARYDAARAEQLVQQAQEAADSGDLASAETAFEQALDAWPTSKPAWEGLAEVYRRQEHQGDLEVARFFAARMDWVASVPPLIASGAFENVAEGRVQIAQENPELRRRSRELVAFLRTRAAQTRDSYYDGEETEFWELVPAAIVSLVLVISSVGAILGN